MNIDLKMNNGNNERNTIQKYFTEQFVKKIKSPVLCRFDNRELPFDSGAVLAECQFDKKYEVDAVSMEEGKLVIALKESVVPAGHQFCRRRTCTD